MVIRELKQRDIRAALEIIKQNYTLEDSYLADFELQEMFSNATIKPKYFVAEMNKQIVGFAGFIQSWMDYDIYNIFWVNVTPCNQKQGIGKLLVSQIISEIKKREAKLILLTADTTKGNDIYYTNGFGFKKLKIFNNSTYCLMCLSLEK